MELSLFQLALMVASLALGQVIRQVKEKAGKRTKEFKLLPPEVNYQNWRLFKRGNTYSLSFPTLHGVKRIPIEIKSYHWQSLDFLPK